MEKEGSPERLIVTSRPSSEGKANVAFQPSCFVIKSHRAELAQSTRQELSTKPLPLRPAYLRTAPLAPKQFNLPFSFLGELDCPSYVNGARRDR